MNRASAQPVSLGCICGNIVTGQLTHYSPGLTLPIAAGQPEVSVWEPWASATETGSTGRPAETRVISADKAGTMLILRRCLICCLLRR
jgi:hypothetical protein